MNDISVELRDVVKIFVTPEGQDLSAVNHVTIQVENGEFFSLLSPRVWEDLSTNDCRF
jgi:ABC-type oligopeptide transport system ATPase subunit